MIARSHQPGLPRTDCGPSDGPQILIPTSTRNTAQRLEPQGRGLASGRPTASALGAFGFGRPLRLAAAYSPPAGRTRTWGPEAQRVSRSLAPELTPGD